MAAKLKSMNGSARKSALDEEGYVLLNEGHEGELRYKVLPHVNVVKDEVGQSHRLEERLIVTFSRKRAEKDKDDRMRLLQKAEELLESPCRIDSSNKRGGKKYIKKLELKLKDAGEPTSFKQIREALNSMNFTKVSVKGEGFLIKVKGTPLSQKILQVMRIKSPKNVTPLKDVKLISQR